jgi:hypothetical protein
MPSPSRTKATRERIITAERERVALELRKGGATFEAIAQCVGYTDRSTARHAVMRALAATLQEPADELRRLELERCDAMQWALWPTVLDGNPEAVRACLRIMLRRSQLLGLDAPAKKLVEVITHDAFSAAVAGVEAEIAELEAARDRSEPAGDRPG